MDKAVNQSDKIEAALMRRLEQIYSDALMEALKKHQAFLKLVKDVADGKKKPPVKYAGDPEKIAKWKSGFLREQMRQMGLIESISKDLAAVGPEAAEEIRNAMVDVYADNREFTTDMIKSAVHTSFSQYDKRQIRALMQETESPFSKIAYKNLGKDTLIRKRLQNEMAMATLLGESQRDIIKRIRKVTGQTAYQAKRVAQTERTRIQSQARYEACQEAANKGVQIVNTWKARMVNTRDAHAERNGKKAEQGKPFPGSEMKYPGDPAGGAAEVINCHCVLVPDVVVKADTSAQKPAKDSFAEANSIAEAEEYAKKFVSSYNGKVDYSGIELEYANDMNRAFKDVLSVYQVKYPLNKIVPMNMRENRFKGTTAEAAYQWGSSNLFFNKSYYKTKKSFSKHVKEYNDLLEVVMPKLDVVISSVINENSFSGKAKLRYYEALKKTGRTNVNPPSAYGSTIHELGHYLDDDLFGKIIRERKINMEESFEKYSGNISAYATANRHEYMAESFTAYWNGEKGILDPAIVAVFEEMRK